jgi:hypothetical protein
MRDLIILFVHIIATLARLLGPGGIRSVVAESVLIKQPDPQSFAAALTQSTFFRSSGCRLVCAPHPPGPLDPFSHRTETFDSLEPPPNSEEPKVSPALLIKAKAQTRAKGTVQRSY